MNIFQQMLAALDAGIPISPNSHGHDLLAAALKKGHLNLDPNDVKLVEEYLVEGFAFDGNEALAAWYRMKDVVSSQPVPYVEGVSRV